MEKTGKSVDVGGEREIGKSMDDIQGYSNNWKVERKNQLDPKGESNIENGKKDLKNDVNKAKYLEKLYSFILLHNKKIRSTLWELHWAQFTKNT